MSTTSSSDLEEVSVYYIQAAGGAHGFPLQGAHRADGGRGGRGEGGRRVRVLVENIIRPRGTLSEAECPTMSPHLMFPHVTCKNVSALREFDHISRW